MRKLLAWVIGLAVLLSPLPALADGRQDYIPLLDPALRRQIQVVLKRDRFYRGQVDGRFGATSQTALRRFRVANKIVEREDWGDGTQGEALDLYLTPKLVKALFGLDIGTGTDELSAARQYSLMKQLGLHPASSRWKNFVPPTE